jgi:glycerate kinase
VAPRIVIAPDKFKGTLTAAAAARHLADGFRAADPWIEVELVPVADGGDGWLDAFFAAGYDRVPVIASGPTGAPMRTSWVRSGRQAVVELAAICGLALLGEQRAPLTATSRGVGEVIAAALAAGCDRILLGIGGSASTDGGLGMVQALGARVLDADGTDVPPDALGAERATRLELDGLRAALRTAVLEVACDVDNPLTGPDGAAAVYAPQKGADPAQIDRLDAALTRWADLVAAATGVDHRTDWGAGAAGGVGFAAVALLGAVLRPGADLLLDALGFADRVRGADLVITGEGRLDAQTLHGKAPARVAAVAGAAGVPVVAVVGECSLGPVEVRAVGFGAVHTLRESASYLDEPLRAPGPLLQRIGERIASTLGAETA